MGRIARIKFHVRSRAFDVSKEVEWVPATMYDDESKVDRYDTGVSTSSLSTFKSTTELEFLDMLRATGAKSVLDIGCGAGAFFHLLRSQFPHARYLGVDLSGAQVRRATTRFGPHFEVRDAATLSVSELAEFDAVHIYSVLSFMAVRDQLELLRRIVRAGCLLLAETTCTKRDVRYAPTSVFKDFSGAQPDGRSLVTAVSFPDVDELARAFRGGHHEVLLTDSDYGSTRALNGSRRAGAALAEKRSIKRKRPLFERILPIPPRWRVVRAKVYPSALDRAILQRYSNMSRDQVYAEIVGRLRPPRGAW